MNTNKIEVPGLTALKACWLVGAIIAIISFFFAIIINVAGGYPIWRGSWDENGSNACNCEKQLENRNKYLKEIGNDLDVVQIRINYFTNALKNKKDKAFVQARVELEREKSKKEVLEDKKKGLIPKPIFPSALGELAIIVIGLLAAFVVARLALKDAQDTFPKKLKFKKDWIKPYLLIAGILIGCTLVEQIIVSILDSDKSWFGWNSFCVSPWSFLLARLTYAADQFAITYALCMFYLLADEQYVPEIKLDCPDGHCGVGTYVDFFHRWTFIGLVAAIIPILWWLHVITKSPASFEKAYLITPASSLIVITYLVLRGVRIASQLRREYQKACTKKMGQSWSAQEAKDLPLDPTREFLGDKWWKLPAVVTAVITAALVALKLLGITGILLSQLLH